MPLVTLSSDFGWAYAAQIKAVLYGRLGPGSVVDLAHDLPTHDIVSSAFLLRSMAARFPAGTIHLAVVDPGVGGARAPIAVACRDGSRLVGPDNGLLDPLARALGVRATVRLRATEAGRVGATFDGRDLFAPAALELALGRPWEELGEAHSLTALAVPPPREAVGGGDGELLWVDPFGNLITNLPTEWLDAGARRVRVRLGGQEETIPVVRVYEELAEGALGLLPSSFGLLEIGLRGARAADHFGVRAHAPVAVRALRPAVRAVQAGGETRRSRRRQREGK